MDNALSLNNRSNEYSFQWGKPFKFLTLKTCNTKLSIYNTSLIIEMNKYYLGCIKGKKTTYNIPIQKINLLESKKSLSFSDLLISIGFLCGGFLINPLLFLFVPLSIWACYNFNILLSTKDGKSLKIPSSNKGGMKEFIQFFNDIYIEA